MVGGCVWSVLGGGGGCVSKWGSQWVMGGRCMCKLGDQCVGWWVYECGVMGV